ncbi:MAG: PUA domain containing protein [Candidatus Bathyarchaeota archaeon B26-2]|nr:MAG: PUA domain containing protein [Candidatus Bathyarchaeota archaeon B26-2]
MTFKQLEALRKIRCIADYQFGRGVGDVLFPEEVVIIHSKRTGRIRYVYLHGELLATLRPLDGLFSLTVEGARRILEGGLAKGMLVVVMDEAAPFVRMGRNVFAKHVVDAAERILPQEEVIVVDGNGEVLAVGRAALTGREMKAFKRGVAVRVRRGAGKAYERRG